MRKQYHFWPGPTGLDAWDVDRLVALSQSVPTEAVEVASLTEIDTSYWYGPGDVPTVRSVVEHFRLVRAVDPSYPVILAADGRVMDGMHRIALALLQGRDTVAAVRFEVTPEPDYPNCRPEDLPYPTED